MYSPADIAALPGGGSLAALAGQVQGNPAGIRDLADRWSRAASDTGTGTAAVNGAVSQVGRTWRGEANSAFSGLMSRFATAGTTTQQSLGSAATRLHNVADTFERVRNQVDTICESLLGQVSQLRAANPGAAPGALDPQIDSLTFGATDQARRAVAPLEDELDQAATGLRGDMSALNGFSALPPSGGPGATPAGAAAGAPPAGPAMGGLSGGGMSWGGRGCGGAGFAAKSRAPGSPAPANGTSAGGAGATSSVNGATTVNEALAAPSSGQAPAAAAGGTPGASPGAAPPTTVAAAAAPAGGASAPADGASGGSTQVDGWISQASQVMEASGVPAAQLNPQDISLIIAHESGGNPAAVNTSDGNAAAGTPSTGLMQVIQPTFDAYALPGHTDITNPVDNIIAGTRYALARYGSLDSVPGVVAVHNGQSYVGY